MINPDCPEAESERRYESFLDKEIVKYEKEYCFFVSNLLNPEIELHNKFLLANSIANAFLSDNTFDEIFQLHGLNYLHAFAWLDNFDMFKEHYEKEFAFHQQEE